MTTPPRPADRCFALVALASLCLALCAAPTPLRAGFDDAEDILVGGTLGGTRGLRVRRIGAGAAAFSLNSTFQYYPASSIKILEHTYAMVLVQAGIWNLAATTAQVCTGDENCTNTLNASAGCGAGAQSMSTVLNTMMVNSSNAATNAVQERVGTTFFPPVLPFVNVMPALGRGQINDFAQDTLGMNDTSLEHKFGCGGFCGNNPANSLTLRDVEKLYRAIATDAGLFTPATRLQLHDLMLNESSFFLQDIIDQEAAATGKNAWKDAFRDLVFKIYKDGSWTCSGKTYRSSSGLIQLPTYNGAYKRLYTWGVFTHDSESWAYLPNTVRDATTELLRVPIRAALLTWGFGYAAAEQTGNAGETVAGLGAAGSPGKEGELILEAAGLLAEAAEVLGAAAIDFEAGIGHIGQAVAKLESANDVVPGSVPLDVFRSLTGIAQEISKDALAMLVMSSDSTILETQVATMERHIASGREAADANQWTPAMTFFADATAGTGAFIDFEARGPKFEDDAEGFVGEPTSGIVFESDFETGAPADWTATSP